MPLENMKNPKTKEKCNIKRMIIAYKRPMNLGNFRDLSTAPPPPPPLSRHISMIRVKGGLCVCVLSVCVCVCVCVLSVCA